MSSNTATIEQQVLELPDIQKLRLVDRILADLDQPDPEIDAVLAKEASLRWQAYRNGQAKTISYAEVLGK